MGASGLLFPSLACCDCHTDAHRLAIGGTSTWSLSVAPLTRGACNSIDSAQMYHNEKESGKAVSDFLSSEANTELVRREDIHFTSKLASNSAYDTARKAIKRSVKECGLGYIDLFLLHSPYGGKQARLDSWRAVEDAIDDGEVKIGGVSNYGVKHVRRRSLLDLLCLFLSQVAAAMPRSWTGRLAAQTAT